MTDKNCCPPALGRRHDEPLPHINLFAAVRELTSDTIKAIRSDGVHDCKDSNGMEKRNMTEPECGRRLAWRETPPFRELNVGLLLAVSW